MLELFTFYLLPLPLTFTPYRLLFDHLSLMYSCCAKDLYEVNTSRVVIQLYVTRFLAIDLRQFHISDYLTYATDNPNLGYIFKGVGYFEKRRLLEWIRRDADDIIKAYSFYRSHNRCSSSSGTGSNLFASRRRELSLFLPELQIQFEL